MSLAGRTIKSWTRIRTWIAATAKGNRRRRLRQTDSMCTLAAQVEQFESRQLLTVTYQGGTLLAHVEAQAVYLGSDWQNTSALQTEKGQLDQFVAYVVNSPLIHIL